MFYSCVFVLPWIGSHPSLKTKDIQFINPCLTNLFRRLNPKGSQNETLRNSILGAS